MGVSGIGSYHCPLWFFSEFWCLDNACDSFRPSNKFKLIVWHTIRPLARWFRILELLSDTHLKFLGNHGLNVKFNMR